MTGTDLGDDFYRVIARLYQESVGQGKRPAVTIAATKGRPVTTVHRWIREARRRGIMPPSAGHGRTAGVVTCPTCAGRGTVRQIGNTGFRPGDWVTWSHPHPLDAGEIGHVKQPTAEDLTYFQEQGYPANRCVLVQWAGDGWDSAWNDPTELRLLGRDES